MIGRFLILGPGDEGQLVKVPTIRSWRLHDGIQAAVKTKWTKTKGYPQKKRTATARDEANYSGILQRKKGTEKRW